MHLRANHHSHALKKELKYYKIASFKSDNLLHPFATTYNLEVFTSEACYP
jgi:hypothetical protein